MNIVIRLKDEKFSSFYEFGENIYRYFDEAYYLINTEKFLTLLKKENEKVFNEIVALRKEEIDEDSFTFKVQYLFCPLTELKYRTYKFKTLKEFGNKILYGAPKIDIYIYDMIKNKLLSYYLKLHKYNELEEKIFNKVIEIENEFEVNPNRAYFKMGFALAETRKIVYRRRWYDSVSSFFAEILKPAEINDFKENFEASQYLFAWLEILGYANELNNYQTIVTTMQEWEEKQC